MAIVSNSSPLIALFRIQRLDLLPALCQDVVIPAAVAREIAPSIPMLPSWLSIKPPAGQPPLSTSRGRLGPGEREAIALALQVRAAAILLDDLPARRVAQAAGLNVVGTIGLVLEAKRRGLLATVRPELDMLIETSFVLGQDLYDRVLKMAGESEL